MKPPNQVKYKECKLNAVKAETEAVDTSEGFFKVIWVECDENGKIL